MRKLVLFFFVLIPFLIQAQIVMPPSEGIDTKAELKIQSTSRGFLIPCLTSVQTNSVANPATGLLIFNTEYNKLFFYNGSAWERIGTLKQYTTGGLPGSPEQGQLIYNTTGNYLEFWNGGSWRKLDVTGTIITP